MCEDSASVDLTSYDIACCIEDVNKCIEIKRRLNDGLPGDSGDCWHCRVCSWHTCTYGCCFLVAVVGGDITSVDNDLEGLFCVKSMASLSQ